MGLEEMFDQAVDLRKLPGRVEALEERVEALEGQPPPDSVGPTLVTVNENGLIEEDAGLPIEAQGDLITGDETGEPVILPVGEDGQVLTADSTAPEGITWGGDTPPFNGSEEVVMGPAQQEIEIAFAPESAPGAFIVTGLFFYGNGGNHAGLIFYYGGVELASTVTGTLDGPIGQFTAWTATPLAGSQTLKIVKQGEASYDLVALAYSFPKQLYTYEMQQGSVVENPVSSATPKMTTVAYNVPSLALASIAINGAIAPVARSLPLVKQGFVDRSGTLYGYEFNAGFLDSGASIVSWQLASKKTYKCNTIGTGLLQP